MKRFLILILLIALQGIVRCQVVSDPTWRLEDIFPSREAWFSTFDSCSTIIKSGSKDQITGIRLRTDQLLKYAQLLSDADMRDREAAEIAGKAEQLHTWAEVILPKINQSGSGQDKSFPVDTGDIFPGLSTGSIIRMLNYQNIPRKDYRLPDSTVILLNYQNMAKVRTSLAARERTLVMQAFWEHQRQYEDTLAVLLEAITRQHYRQALQQGYTECLESALTPDSIPVAIYHTLIKTVRENLEPMHRYIRLKQHILGLDTFRYADLYTTAVPEVTPDIPLEQGLRILKNALSVLGPEYIDILDTALTGRWIDYYPREGKYPSNWTTGVYGVHPYILMNYSGNYESLTILAHELGHAIHYWFTSHNQPFEYSEPGSFLSEVPSMLNETLLLQWILEHESNVQMKLYLLDGYLERIRNGIYRQTLFAEFDLLKHEWIEAGDPLSAQWLDSTYLALLRDYYGHDAEVMQVDEYICCEWTMIPDPDLNFTVYQYPVGIISSLLLTEQINEPGGPAPYLDLLKAGRSDTPLNLLEQAGIDLSTPLSYLNAIQWFDWMVTEMERLYRIVGTVK